MNKIGTLETSHRGTADRARTVLLTLAAAVAVALTTSCGGTARLDGILYNNESVQSLSSGITVLRGGSKLPVQSGMSLQTNDTLQTDSKSSAHLTFPSGSKVLVYPSTKVKIGSIWIDWGTIFAWAKGAFSVETDSGVAAVVRTEFFVRRKGSNELEVDVLEGVVNLKSKRNGAQVTLQKAERGTLRKDAVLRGKPTKNPLSGRSVRSLEGNRNAMRTRLKRPPLPGPLPIRGRESGSGSGPRPATPHGVNQPNPPHGVNQPSPGPNDSYWDPRRRRWVKP